MTTSTLSAATKTTEENAANRLTCTLVVFIVRTRLIFTAEWSIVATRNALHEVAGDVCFLAACHYMGIGAVKFVVANGKAGVEFFSYREQDIIRASWLLMWLLKLRCFFGLKGQTHKVTKILS
jgi:hypothetical protein